ncbi:MAG: M23 family metallopeptidase [Myxococcales bacterium]|nr:M23 family metallopeptidase [Myxococcales bacterium]
MLIDRPRRMPMNVGPWLALALLAGTGVGMVILSRDDVSPPPPPKADASVVVAPLPERPPLPEMPPPPEPPAWIEHEGVLDKDQTLGAALEAQGVSGSQVHAIVAALSGLYDFRNARPGAAFALRRDRASGELLSFRFEHGPLEIFAVERGLDGRYVGHQVEVPVRVVEAEVGAEIRASLYRAMQRVGESPGLVALVTDVFAWDIDFYKNTHAGDRFRVVVEKIYKDADFIRYGRILAAEYAGEVGTFRTFWFAPEGEEGHYYLEDGQSAEKSFLATPLKFARISSGFGRRRHPVLGYTKAHMGVDYAAPVGTPVWAMAAGVVTWADWKGPNGKLVRIDHGGGLESAYAHLSRIGPGIKKGARVRQKQVIGNVGTTGRSTGPHLHFAIKRGGGYIDPSRLKITRGKPITEARRDAFAALVARRTAQLEGIVAQGAPGEEPDDEAGPEEAAQ